MNWELAEYFLSKFYTVSRAVSTEDATWLFHNLLCALSPLSAEHLQLFPWSDVQTKVKMRSTQIPIPIFFIFYLSYFVYYTMGVRRRGEGGKTAPKYSEKIWSLYACASGAHWGTIFWTCTRTGQSIYRSFSRSPRLHEGWRGEEGEGSCRLGQRLDAGRGVSARHRNFLNAAWTVAHRGATTTASDRDRNDDDDVDCNADCDIRFHFELQPLGVASLGQLQLLVSCRVLPCFALPLHFMSCISLFLSLTHLACTCRIHCAARFVPLLHLMFDFDCDFDCDCDSDCDCNSVTSACAFVMFAFPFPFAFDFFYAFDFNTFETAAVGSSMSKLLIGYLARDP